MGIDTNFEWRYPPVLLKGFGVSITLCLDCLTESRHGEFHVPGAAQSHKIISSLVYFVVSKFVIFISTVGFKDLVR